MDKTRNCRDRSAVLSIVALSAAMTLSLDAQGFVAWMATLPGRDTETAIAMYYIAQWLTAVLLAHAGSEVVIAQTRLARWGWFAQPGKAGAMSQLAVGLGGLAGVALARRLLDAEIELSASELWALTALLVACSMGLVTTALSDLLKLHHMQLEQESKAKAQDK